MSQDRQNELFNYRKAVLRLWNLPIAPLHTPLLCIAQPEHAHEAGGGAFSNLDQLLAMAQQRSLPARVRPPARRRPAVIAWLRLVCAVSLAPMRSMDWRGRMRRIGAPCTAAKTRARPQGMPA